MQALTTVMQHGVNESDNVSALQKEMVCRRIVIVKERQSL